MSKKLVVWQDLILKRHIHSLSNLCVLEEKGMSCFHNTTLFIMVIFIFPQKLLAPEIARLHKAFLRDNGA